MKMKKLAAVLLALMMFLVACGGQPAESGEANASGEANGKVLKVCNLVNGNLGDKSFFDSAERGLKELEEAGRIELKTIEMGATDADKPKWEQTLNEVSESGEYDVIVLGTYQMPEFLKPAAEANPDQKYVIYDGEHVGLPNVATLNFKQNDLGYVIGTIAGAMTKLTDVERINDKNVIGFVGGEDGPVINDFLYGYILGAQAVNPDIKVDTRYINNFYDTAVAKELALSMINDKGADIIWGVAGLAGNGGVEACQETGKAWFLGVDSDQELTLPAELAAVTLTSGLKSIDKALVWFFDELDKGNELFGQETILGAAEGGIGIIEDKNYEKFVPEEVRKAVEKAIEDITSGAVVVPSAIGEQAAEGETKTGAELLRDQMQP